MANIQNIEEYDNYSYNTWMISNAHFIKGILEDPYSKRKGYHINLCVLQSVDKEVIYPGNTWVPLTKISHSSSKLNN